MIKKALTRARSAISGRFVTKATAKASPATTVSENVNNQRVFATVEEAMAEAYPGETVRIRKMDAGYIPAPSHSSGSKSWSRLDANMVMRFQMGEKTGVELFTYFMGKMTKEDLAEIAAKASAEAEFRSIVGHA